ncbi:MAG: phosphomannomutase/phosphoglucomutase [Hornefia sp.]|nr:phosphomannomutase/phosphoglucomutase [Hornefia sp.]
MANYDYSRLQNGSDIRGVALEGVLGETVTIDEETTTRIAKGFLYWLSLETGKKPSEIRISLGRDSRLSGKTLLDNFAKALVQYGVTVLDAELASTPAMFMSTVFSEYTADGAVMITASHLPWNRNGFKFFTGKGGLDKGDITDILTFAESSQILARLLHSERGSLRKIPLLDTYSAHLRKIIVKETGSEKPLTGMKICVDAGNGAGGFYAGKVLAPLGADISSSQFLEPDGSFPNHQPNPENKEAMKYITETVIREKCDLGIIFDTDVDRSSAVDEHGNEIARNEIVAMAAALIADKYPGTTVVTDSVTGDELNHFLKEDLGLSHLRFKRGYRNVINKAIELNEQGIPSHLAIETSGHAAYKDNFFLDDGAFLATRIVIKSAQLFKDGLGISSVLEKLSAPEESIEARIPITSRDFAPCAEKALAKVRELAGTHIDGIRLALVQPNYEGIRLAYSGKYNGWLLIRKSLHDPILPINIESKEKGGSKAIKKILCRVLSQVEGIDATPLK